MIFFVSKHTSLNAFIPSHYLRNMHFIHFALNFLFYSFGTIAYAMLLKTQMCTMQGLVLFYIFLYVPERKAFFRHRFRI